MPSKNPKPKKLKLRSPVARAMFSDPQFKPRVVKSKKTYNRKKEKIELEKEKC